MNTWSIGFFLVSSSLDEAKLEYTRLIHILLFIFIHQREVIAYWSRATRMQCTLLEV